MEEIFRAENMRKEFGPTVALKDVTFRLNRGEIRGLVGENGSGKSTIMSIASGMQEATHGQMFYKGEPWKPKSMVEAQKAGISMILQEANTFSNVTVAQNILSGQEEKFSKLGVFSLSQMARYAQKRLDSLGISHIRAGASINAYNFEDRKLVELVRCVTEDTEILVVDETTTALSHEGRRILYDLIHEMTEKRNKAVVLVSHDMDEIVEQCTVLTVLRDGEIIGEIPPEDMALAKTDTGKRREVIRNARYMMVGREIGERYYREDYDPSHSGKPALEINNASFGEIMNFSLTVHEGEIVGIGGLSGCGMHEVGRAAFGLGKLRKGQVARNGSKITGPLSAIRSGIGYISKNRDLEALILQGSVGDNILLPSLDALSRATFINPKDEKKLVGGQVENFSIKCYSSKQWVRTLSGGNKQKVSFAKWTAKDSDVFIMDCPTRGVDVRVKQFMYGLIDEMKKRGKAILMISEELSELVGMADRLIIMKDFEVTKEFERSPDLKQTDIIEYML